MVRRVSVEFRENGPEIINDENYNNEGGKRGRCCCWYSSNDDSFVNQVDNNGGGGGENVYKCLKKKRKHYTVRRSPGMISHLLPLQRLDSIMTHTKLKENNINLKSKVFLKKTLVRKNQNLDVVGCMDLEDSNTIDFDNQAQTTNTILNTFSKNIEENNVIIDDDQSSLNDVDSINNDTVNYRNVSYV